MKKIYESIVYITDKPPEMKQIDLTNDNLEINSKYASNKILETLKKIAYKVYFYDNIEEFSQNIKKHKHDIVFPTYYGVSAANSKSLIPAICEANNIKYVGADSYTHMICNDKYLAKKYASHYQIKSAKDVIIRDPGNLYELSLLKTLKFPIVVKPNFGGGSSGISQDNILHDYNQAINYVKELYKYHRQPILAEEFLDGYEVELVLLGTSKSIKVSHEVQLIIDDKTFFTNEIWGYETKKVDDSKVNFKTSSFILQKDKNNIIELFKSFEKIDFMRFDCRINSNGELRLIELSPDCYLGEDCAFFFAFNERGFSYEEMIMAIIKNCMDHYQKI